MSSRIKNKKRFISVVTGAGLLFSAGMIFGLNGWFGGGGSIPEDTFTRGLVGYWAFEEASGQTAYDGSDYSNKGENGVNSIFLLMLKKQPTDVAHLKSIDKKTSIELQYRFF